MSFIDWSDDEGIFGLLIEFVVDERNDAVADPKRKRFLTGLLADLHATKERFDENHADAINQLKTIYDSIDSEFRNDVVVVHIGDCIDELESIQ